ncbi:MAG: translocation/assembly module TamB domain-containing protein [Thermoanaerobaculales bacterium]
MRYRHLRRTVIAVLAAVAFVLLLGLLLRWILEAEPTRRLAIDRIERLAAGSGAEVEIGDLHWGLFPPAVHLREVDLQMGGVTAEVESLQVDLGRVWLTRRTVELGTVAARGVRLSMDGSPTLHRRGDGPRLKLKVRHLELEQVELSGAHLPGKISFNMDGVRAGWTTEDGEARGFATIARAQVQPGKMRPFEGAIEARFALTSGGLDVRTLSVSGTGFDFRGHGRVAAGGGLFAEADGRVDLRWLDRQINTHDLFEGDIQFSAVIDTSAEALLRTRIRSSHLAAAGFPLDDVEGSLVLNGKQLRGELSRSTFHGGSLSGTYTLGEFGGVYPHEVRVEATGMSLAGILKNLNVAPAGLAAEVDTDVHLTWNGSGLRHGSGHASVLMRPMSFGLPVAGPVNVDLTGEGLLRFNAPDLSLGKSRLSWQGALTLATWEPAWAISASPAELSEVAALVNAWVGSTVLPAELEGTGDLKVNLSGPFKELVVTARLDAQPFILPPVRLDRLVAEATISGATLRLGSTRFQVADGFGEVEGSLGWGAASGDEQLNLEIRARRLPLSALASWIDLEDWVEAGRLAVAGGLRGPLAMPHGSWAVGLDDVRLGGLDLGDASAAVDLVEGRFVAHDLRCAKGLQGELAWDVIGAEIGGTMRWPRMPLAVLGEPIARMFGDFADVQLEFVLPGDPAAPPQPGGGSEEDQDVMPEDPSREEVSGRVSTIARPTGRLIATSENSRIDVAVDRTSVRLDAQLEDAAQATALLERGDDRSLRGAGELVLSSAQELIERLAPDAGVPLTGSGHAVFSVDWADESWPRISGRIERLELELEDQPVRLIRPADFTLSEEGFTVPGLELRAHNDEMFVRWTVGRDGVLKGNLSGTMDALLLRFLLPDWEPAGRATGIVEVLGTVENPSFEGIAEIHKGSFRLPGTRTILSNVGGTALLSADEVSLEGMDFRLMQGLGRASGRIFQSDETVALALAGEVKGLRFTVLPKLDARLSGSWNLAGAVDDLVLSGDLTLDRMTLGTKDDVTTILLDWFGGPETTREEGGLGLDLHVEADETIEIRNPFVRLVGSASLDVTGTSSRPGLVGKVEFVEGGEATILGNRYELERGSLSFSDPDSIDPFIDLQASTWVQDFQITVHLSGNSDRIVPSVVSTPPLNAPEIYSLLGVGYINEAYGGGAMGLSLASSILSRQLTSELSRRANLVLPVDQVRVDPFAADSTGNPTARLSVVKQITPSWTVILQSTLSGEREQLVVSRWYLAPGLFIEAAQHEDNSLSLDLKLRRPY